MFGNITPALMRAIMENITADGGNVIANAQDNRLAPKTLSFNKTPQSLGPPVTAAETLAVTPQAAEPQSIAPAEVADNRLAPKTLSFNFTPQSLGPPVTAAETLAADSPAEPEAPEGFEFVGTVNTFLGGPETKAFRKIGDDTGFTIYQREIQVGKNKGKQGFFFDDVQDDFPTARTGGYLNADDAYNQGRTSSSNYVHHFNTLMDRGVELTPDAVDVLNDALAHHDKYLGGNEAYAPRRGAILETLNDVQNYMSDSEGVPINIEPSPIQLPVTAPAFETIVNPNRPVPGITEEAPAPEDVYVQPIEPGGDFGLPAPAPEDVYVQPIEPGGDFGLPAPAPEDVYVQPIEPGGDFGLPAPAPVYDPGQQISTAPFF